MADPTNPPDPLGPLGPTGAAGSMSDSLDGNVAAGMLSEVFMHEMTAAITTCANCGDSHAIGELRSYVQAPGLVMRCPSCSAVQARMVRAPERGWLDLRGIRALQVDLPSLG